MATPKQDARYLEHTRAALKDIEDRVERTRKMPETGRRAILDAVRDLRTMLIEAEIQEIREGQLRLEGLLERELLPYEKSAWREYAETIGIAVVVALVLRAFVVGAFRIPSGSMKPTLLIGDHLFATKFSYGLQVPFVSGYALRWAEPERGDVVVFEFPRDEARVYLQMQPAAQRTCLEQSALEEDRDMIKRVVGVAGDEVEVRDNIVFLNGKPLDRTFIRQEPTGEYLRPLETVEREVNGDATYNVRFVGAKTQEFGPVKVQDGHIFVLGDNRDESADGRCWGQVPIEKVIGKAQILWWSVSDTGVRWERFGRLIK